MDDRRKAIEALVKNIKDSDSADVGYDFSGKVPFNQQLLQARDLTEDALANEVLKNTGIPIPSDKASLSKKEDFYNRILEETYPEFKSDLKINPKLKDLGIYDPNNGGIELNPKSTEDLRRGLAVSLHEGAHKYDDKVLNYNLPKSLTTGKNADTQLNLDKSLNKFLGADEIIDPSKLYDIAAKGHHAKIPNLRDADSFGLGALKSMLKSGTFKALPYIGTAASLGTGLMSGDASAAIPILGDAEELGPEKGSEDDFIENPNPKMSNEDRQKALKKMLEQR